TWFEGEWILQPESVRWHAEPYREDYGHYMGAVRNRFYPATAEQTLKTRIGNLIQQYWYSDFQPSIEFASDDEVLGLPAYGRTLGLLNDVCEMDDIELILMTQPFTDQRRYFRSIWLSDEQGRPLHDEDFSRGMQRYNQAMRNFAGANNRKLIDLEQLNQDRADLFTDEVHQKPAGLKQTAGEVYRVLKALR
ncbi:MAG: hypothetical protein AAF492_22840, partial [Verrucomicrobiota bacterium]